MRIPTLLQKIAELSAQPERRTAIDVDLMLDYTRVLYADLLEWRSKLPATLQQAPEPAAPPIQREAMPAELKDIGETKLAFAPQQETARPSPPKATENTPANAASNLNDIRALIGINDKYQIMSELFSNDKAAYEQTLDYINQSSGERKALDWLREQLWITEERSEVAGTFFEIVERFFAAK